MLSLQRRLVSKLYPTLCVNNSGTFRHLYTLIYIPDPAEIKEEFEKKKSISEKMLLISYVDICQID